MLTKALKAGRTRKQEDFVANECVCIAVFQPPESFNPPGHRAGEEASHMLMKKWDTFLGNIKAMLACGFNARPDDVDEADAVHATGSEQPLAGVVMEVNCQNIVTKAGGQFTTVNYVRRVPAAELAQHFTSDGGDPRLMDLHLGGQEGLERMHQVDIQLGLAQA